VEIQAILYGPAPARPIQIFTMKLKKKATVARRVRRTHNPEFKACMALAALRKDKTMAQLCQDFELHANQIAGHQPGRRVLPTTRRQRSRTQGDALY
jgi:transposase-like protein